MIGIMTWYKSHNYGSVLQSYAMLQNLKTIGLEGQMINYPINAGLSISKTDKFGDFLKRVPPALKRRLFWKDFNEKVSKFDEFFSDYIAESPRYLHKEQIPVDNYEAFVCGSDQIWTPSKFGIDTAYFLDFVPDSMKKVAYAPSIGWKQIPKQFESIMSKNINRIDNLSIREEHGAEIIASICEGRQAEVVLDPTLLVDQMAWNKIQVDVKIEEPYILCYFLGERDKPREIVEKIKEKTGYSIIVIPALTKDLFWGDERKIAAGPAEFVSLINHAQVVCTDSLHGCLLSIAQQKEFFAFRRHESQDPENQNMRITNILKRLGLSHRYVLDESSIPVLEDSIDYTSVNKLLNDEREVSWRFLKNAFNIV
jgi:hypothetical protein